MELPTETEKISNKEDDRKRDTPFNIEFGGIMGGYLSNQMDWSRCPLGHYSTWNKRFVNYLSLICSNDKFPMALLLTRELVLFYNDAYIPIYQDSHPRIFGIKSLEQTGEYLVLTTSSAKDAFPDQMAYESMASSFYAVLDKKKPVSYEDVFMGIFQRFSIDSYDLKAFPFGKRGKLLETYFSATYSPIWDTETGEVDGILATVIPVEASTWNVISKRQNATLQEFSTRVSEAKSLTQAYTLSMEVLKRNPSDVPFAQLYIVQAAPITTSTGNPENPLTLGKHNEIVLVEAFGEPEDDASPLFYPKFKTNHDFKTDPMFASDSQSFAKDESEKERTPSKKFAPYFEAIVHVASTGFTAKVDLTPCNDRLSLCGRWSHRIEECFVVPISLVGQNHQRFAILVFGIGTMRVFNERYEDFLLMCSHQFGVLFSNAKAFEEEKKQSEILQELDKAKTEFFHNISHEFRTPLTLILGPLEELLRSGGKTGGVTPDLREKISMIYRNGIRLLKLVNNLLDFSRLQYGRLQARFSPVDICKVIRDVCDPFLEAMEVAGINFVIEQEELPSLVYVDRDMFERIVGNIISNAFKYTLEGQIKISVKYKANSNEVTIQVEDTGCGISQNDLQRVFDRFYRVQNSKGRSHEGSGIGLSMVEELVKLHHGRITLESKENVGTIVTVYLKLGIDHLPSDQLANELPEMSVLKSNRAAKSWWIPSEMLNREGIEINRVLSEDSALSLKSLQEFSETSSEISENILHDTPKFNVLVVDDNADMRKFICDILQVEFNVTLAENGLIALEALKQTIPDLVLTDIQMPQLDGFGLLREIRANPNWVSIPVIFVTARAGEDSIAQGLEQVDNIVNDYLVKPFTAKELMRRVRSNVTVHKLQIKSAEKERELLLKETKMKDNFLAMLSHELRTPLAPALLIVEDIEKEFLEIANSFKMDVSSFKGNISMLKRSINLEVRLIDDLLDLTRVTKGKIRLHLETSNLHDVLNHTVQLLGYEAQMQKVKIITNFTAKNYILKCDSARVQQIFWNLIKNAIKFTPQNGQVSIITENPSPDQFKVEVTDTGVGISAETIGKLFAAFEQGDNKTFGGLGLGLYISRVVASLHQGELQAASKGENQGATFTVFLPIRESRSIQQSASTTDNIIASPTTVPSKKRPLYVLLIEDNHTTNVVMTKILQRLGHRVDSATSGTDTLSKVDAMIAECERDPEHKPYDIILSDLGLPDMTGWELIEMIAQKWKSSKALQDKTYKSIALSGYGMEEDVKKSTESGFNMHLTKPVQTNTLDTAMSQLMDS